MGGQQRGNFPCVGGVKLSGDVVGRGVVDLRLGEINESREVWPGGVVNNGISTQAIVGIIGDWMVTTNFTLVEIVSFRDGTQIGWAVAAEIILHAFHSRVTDGVVDPGEWAGVC